MVFQNYIHRHHVTTSAHHIRIYILNLELRTRKRTEASQMVIGGSGQQTGEWNGNIMVGIHQCIPLANFIIERSLTGEFIRVSAGKSRGFTGTVKLDKQTMPGSRLENFFLNTYHLLVVTIQEIDHQAFYTPLFIECKSLFQLIIEWSPMYPQMYSHSFTLGILYDTRHIQARYRTGDVGIRTCPAEVEVIVIIPGSFGIPINTMGIQTVTGCKINVILVCLKVVSGRESTIRHHIAVPPGECSPARLYP